MTEGLRNINLSISVAGLVLSIIGMFNILLSRYLEKGSRRFFAIIFGVLNTYVFFIFIRNATYYHVGYGWVVLSRIAFLAQALMSSVLTVLITGFLLYQSGRIRWWKELVFCVSAVLWCIYVAILIYAQFTNAIYYVDDQNGYHRGEFFSVLMAAPVLIMVLNVYALWQNRKRLTKKQEGAFLVYATVPLLAMLLQSAFFGIQFIVLGTVLAASIMYSYIATSQRDAYYRQVTENEHLKINILLAQIQPHFLYNSLTTIKYLCGEDPHKAQEAVNEFADYLRNHMDSITIDTPIPFMDEMKQVQEYLSLQKLRFGKELNVEYRLEDTEFKLPTLTLQPLVENAVIHGIRGSKDGMGTVTIRSKRLADCVEVSVTDDGNGFEYDAATYSECSTHKGISNACERLKRICGGEIKIDSVIGKGTTATIILPEKGENLKC